MSSRFSNSTAQQNFHRKTSSILCSSISLRRWRLVIIVFSLLSILLLFFTALFFLPQNEQNYQLQLKSPYRNIIPRIDALEQQIKLQQDLFQQNIIRLNQLIAESKDPQKMSQMSQNLKDFQNLVSNNFQTIYGSNINPKEIQEGNRPSNVSVAQLRDKVKQMMKHAWDGYAKHAWGANEVRPISLQAHNNIIFGRHPLGATLVDGLDSLFIMGLKDEYNAGRAWIAEHLNFDIDSEISVFEFNIRYLGSFLTMFTFTGDKLYLTKAVELVDRLLPAFNTQTGLPLALVNLKTGSSRNYQWASSGSSILSEFGTLHMEFAYLSELTGNKTYLQKVMNIRDLLQRAGSRPHGLYPNYLHPRNLQWGQMHSSLAGMGDSFYEYLLKEHIRTGGQDIKARELYDDAMRAMEKWMFKRSPSGLLYVGDYKYGRVENKMDHLACFGGGMFALSANTSTTTITNPTITTTSSSTSSNSVNPPGAVTSKIAKWLNYGEELTRTCHESYIRTVTHLGPESFHFTSSFEAQAMQPRERAYLLRPETIESYFYLWRLTKNQQYRDWAADFLQALEKNCRVVGGYSGISDVNTASSNMDDVQQSYFLAETLKYLYLIFSDDDVLPLDRWVFNSEAHPFPIRGRIHFPSWSS